MTVTMHAITVAPATEPVALTKISIKAKPVGDFKAVSRSTVTKRVAIIIAKAKAPLMIILNRIDHGTTVGAFWISSDIYGK